MFVVLPQLLFCEHYLQPYNLMLYALMPSTSGSIRKIVTLGPGPDECYPRCARATLIILAGPSSNNFPIPPSVSSINI